MKSTIGDKIIAARNNIGYTRKKLADEIGVHPEQLRHWEKGIRHPKREAIQKIASACEIDDQFFFDTEVKIEDLPYHTYEYFVPFVGRESYYLTDDNHIRIQDFAMEKHIDPSAAVNYILDQFFSESKNQ